MYIDKADLITVLSYYYNIYRKINAKYLLISKIAILILDGFN